MSVFSAACYNTDLFNFKNEHTYNAQLHIIYNFNPVVTYMVNQQSMLVLLSDVSFIETCTTI